MRHIISFMILAFVLTGCMSNPSINNDDVNSNIINIDSTEDKTNEELESKYDENIQKKPSEYIDQRAKIRGSFEMPEDAVTIYIGPMTAEVAQWDSPVTVTEMAKLVTNVVVGEVLDITYCDTDGTAYTFYSFAVEDVLKGDEIEIESIITVLEYQGYKRMTTLDALGTGYACEEYENYKGDRSKAFTIHNYANEPLVQVGDKYILFLSSKNHAFPLDFVEGDFFRNELMFSGKYTMNEDGLYAKFIPYHEEMRHKRVDETTGEVVLIEQPMTLEEMKTLIVQ